jgi:hypothetical protein
MAIVDKGQITEDGAQGMPWKFKYSISQDSSGLVNTMNLTRGIG